MIARILKFVNLIAKGVIYGNVVNSNGGGVYIVGALNRVA